MVGYTVVKLTYKHGYKLGPVFADSIAIAEKLLKSLFEELIQSPPPVDCFDVIERPLKLAKNCEQLFYIVAKQLPNTCYEKQFGITDIYLG